MVQAFQHLDTSIHLSRERAAQGLYPAVDPLASSSRLLDPARIGERHYQVAMHVKQMFKRYQEVREIIALMGMAELRHEDQQLIGGVRRLERFLTQPLFTTEASTGQSGRSVTREQTLFGCEAILRGELDAVDERRLGMIGGIEESRA